MTYRDFAHLLADMPGCSPRCTTCLGHLIISAAVATGRYPSPFILLTEHLFRGFCMCRCAQFYLELPLQSSVRLEVSPVDSQLGHRWRAMAVWPRSHRERSTQPSLPGHRRMLAIARLWHQSPTQISEWHVKRIILVLVLFRNETIPQASRPRCLAWLSMTTGWYRS